MWARPAVVSIDDDNLTPVLDARLRRGWPRGWQRERSRMPYNLRLAAATNEVRLYQRHPSPYILWALAKYLLVRWARL